MTGRRIPIKGEPNYSLEIIKYDKACKATRYVIINTLPFMHACENRCHMLAVSEWVYYLSSGITDQCASQQSALLCILLC